MPADEYFAVKGELKLKRVDDSGIKKKKKKKKDKEKNLEANIRKEVDLDNINKGYYPMATKTKAELKFEERRRKKEEERILKKASKSHKEKVEDFNRHLDTLTEHFDIPKVSWTK